MKPRFAGILACRRLFQLVGPVRKMAAESSVVLKGKASFSVDPATLTPEEKKNLITRNLQVRAHYYSCSQRRDETM